MPDDDFQNRRLLLSKPILPAVARGSRPGAESPPSPSSLIVCRPLPSDLEPLSSVSCVCIHPSKNGPPSGASCSALRVLVVPATTTSAVFCRPIPARPDGIAAVGDATEGIFDGQCVEGSRIVVACPFFDVGVARVSILGFPRVS
jgi:hypothetical protein